MAHLAAAPRLAPCRTDAASPRGCASTSRPLGLARRVASGAGEPDVAQQVHHHRRRVLARVAERQAGEHARLLLELRRDARVDRVVAAVVRPRRDLVDQQRAVARRRTSRRTARRGSRARAATRVAMSRALRPQAAAATRAGTIETSRMPSRCRFSATGQVAVSPRSLRATITDTSQRERRRSCSSTHGCAAHRARTRRATSSRVRTRTWPLPS